MKQVRQLEIEAEGDPRQEFENGHFGTKPGPNRSELETDRARADNEEFARRFCESKRFGAADDCFAVKFRKRQFDRRAASRDDDVFSFDLLRFSVRGFDRNFSGRGYCAEAFEGRHLVSLHQCAHAAGQRFHDLLLALLHLIKIDIDAADDDAVLLRFFFRENEMIARSQEGFTWNAAHVQTSAAEILVLLDHGGFETELSRPDRGDIAARSRTNDYEIKSFHLTISFCHSDRSGGISHYFCPVLARKYLEMSRLRST